jgi:hypothetical protein
MSESSGGATRKTTSPNALRWIRSGAIAVGLLVVLVVWSRRDNQDSQTRQQGQRMQKLAATLKQNLGPDQVFPTQLPASADPIGIDVATGKPLIYQPVTRAGEKIRYAEFGERFIAWTPEASYSGRRAVLANDLSLHLASDQQLDFTAQRIVIDDPLRRARDKAIDDEEPSEEPEPTTNTATTEP